MFPLKPFVSPLAHCRDVMPIADPNVDNLAQKHHRNYDLFF